MVNMRSILQNPTAFIDAGRSLVDGIDAIFFGSFWKSILMTIQVAFFCFLVVFAIGVALILPSIIVHGS